MFSDYLDFNKILDGVQITYAKRSFAIPDEYFNTIGQRLLPTSEFQKLTQYVQRSDRELSFLGKLLLFFELNNLETHVHDLKDLAFTKFGKPILKSENRLLSFNISHSGEYVVVAMAASQNVGIDIEKNKHVKSTDFHSVFTREELSKIGSDSSKFFSLWTRKESALKAYGEGFHRDLTLTHFSENIAVIDGSTFYFQNVPVPDPYTCTVAFEKEDSPIRTKEVIIGSEFLSEMSSRCNLA